MGYKVHLMKFIEDPDCPLVHQIINGTVKVHGRKASAKNNKISVGDKILLQVFDKQINTTVLEVRVSDIKQYGDIFEFFHSEMLPALVGDPTKCMNIKNENDYAEYYSKFVDLHEILQLKRDQGFGMLGLHIEFIREYQILKKNVQEPWFSHIKSGKKKVEGRLNKSWVSTLQKIDRIIWADADSQFSTIVEDLKHYGSFKEMLEKEGIQNVLPGIDTIEDGVQIYRKFYSEADEKKFGVIGIHLKLL